ncbi:A/G-specific adenine glycosylase [Candidatus Rhabdochlamydia porcellionis]|uniref:Adenine DNA glycosylase n=1 Tax=Candidatus Rhabdochlamydia porcellionis TaxID=225148 RepID=A0ABX8YY19_9BACT|nr:A/G-specific adenine glycosylase [Candidatus Rhabdochlamydia porcellionis]QZA58176.1 Adenine DNA glycosylase [Candidatus Rhabdochlamydia porcellionis]
MDIEALKKWFLAQKRDFSWRISPTPYGVWISEVMLQQTRASVVEGHFERWMILFPDVKTLALAPQVEIIKAWEGLGYYNRARNLHLAAKYILEKYEGVIPDNREELEKIKGLGPYTVGALLNFAFHQKAAAVDANVTRVLARYYYVEEDVTKAKTKQLIQLKTENLLPETEPWVCMEALIELGSLVCSKVAKCIKCPIKRGCRARELKSQHRLPKKPPKKKVQLLHRNVIVLVYQDSVLLRKTESGLMADLYEFPYFEKEKSQEEILLTFLSREAIYQQHLNAVNHTFTHFKAILLPSVWRALRKEIFSNYIWVLKKDLVKFPFSAGHRKIIQQIEGIR